MSRAALLNDRTNPNESLTAPGDNECGTLACSASASGCVPAIAISLHSVTKHFGRFAALRGVTADFNSGRLYTILGDNGAGKSTLLRIVAGLLQPTRGSVAVLGTTHLRDVRPRVGYMAHAPLLYDELDAMENLRYFAGLYGIRSNVKPAPSEPRAANRMTTPLMAEPAPGADDICRRAIITVGLDPTLKRRVGQYSQGMRQRLSLARSVLNDPNLLLLDEPFSNVDIASAHEMVNLLGHMRDAGKTIFLVTHQPSLLEQTTDEFVHMSLGRIDGRAGVAHPASGAASGVAPGSSPADPLFSSEPNEVRR